eukprot:s3168_g2.t1
MVVQASLGANKPIISPSFWSNGHLCCDAEVLQSCLDRRSVLTSRNSHSMCASNDDIRDPEQDMEEFRCNLCEIRRRRTALKSAIETLETL